MNHLPLPVPSDAPFMQQAAFRLPPLIDVTCMDHDQVTTLMKSQRIESLKVDFNPSVRTEMDDYARQLLARMRSPPAEYVALTLRERILDIDAIHWLVTWLRAMKRELYGPAHLRRYL